MHPKIKEVVMKHWHHLHVNPNLVHNLAKCVNVCLQTKWMWVRVLLQLHLAEIFQNPPLLAFCWRLQRLYWYQIIKNSKVKRNFINKMQGKCAPCLANNRTLCWEQVTNTTAFSSNQTIRTFQINHNLNCKNKYVMYLLECTKCKMQYLEKLKLSSILDLATTERMYGNMLYQQAIIFQAKTITSAYMRNN